MLRIVPCNITFIVAVKSQLLIPVQQINKNMKFCLSLFQSNHNNGNPDVGKFRHDYT